MLRASTRARGPSVDGTPIDRRPSRRTSYPDLGNPVKHADPADPASWPAWTDDARYALSEAESWPAWTDRSTAELGPGESWEGVAGG